ncbi:MAG: succinate dehydrogenase, cytochrome b556 subunit [Kordiimonas sp.]|nr:succinate dehydrogenase, cytochrome b556 subunit [Kordiimonas sp.]|tara:strand:- start:1491 stop:1877 length:387 start_codon:yes stop_codon:yes gene_type:complete
MAHKKRPVSPHLQVYKWGLHMALSTFQRLTGLFLGLGTVFIAWWLIAIAMGPDAYQQVQVCMSSWIGRLVLFAFTFSLMLHMCNGIRHLFWDAGIGFDLQVTARANYIVIISAVTLTLLAWVVAYGLV